MSSQLSENLRIYRAMAICAWVFVRKQAPGKVILNQPSNLYNVLELDQTVLANNSQDLNVVDDENKAIQAVFYGPHFYASYDRFYQKLKIEFSGKTFKALDLRDGEIAEFYGSFEGDSDKYVILEPHKGFPVKLEFEIYPKYTR